MSVEVPQKYSPRFQLVEEKVLQGMVTSNERAKMMIMEGKGEGDGATVRHVIVIDPRLAAGA